MLFFLLASIPALYIRTYRTKRHTPRPNSERWKSFGENQTKTDYIVNKLCAPGKRFSNRICVDLSTLSNATKCKRRLWRYDAYTLVAAAAPCRTQACKVYCFSVYIFFKRFGVMLSEQCCFFLGYASGKAMSYVINSEIAANSTPHPKALLIEHSAISLLVI